ncbi:MAG: hypothetical protein LBR30_05040, partial [Clostridioides sp.]|nr:hypothetical protein [Clostridioides sp.]
MEAVKQKRKTRIKSNYNFLALFTLVLMLFIIFYSNDKNMFMTLHIFIGVGFMTMGIISFIKDNRSKSKLSSIYSIMTIVMGFFYTNIAYYYKINFLNINTNLYQYIFIELNCDTIMIFYLYLELYEFTNREQDKTNSAIITFLITFFIVETLLLLRFFRSENFEYIIPKIELFMDIFDILLLLNFIFCTYKIKDSLKKVLKNYFFS